MIHFPIHPEWTSEFLPAESVDITDRIANTGLNVLLNYNSPDLDSPYDGIGDVFFRKHHNFKAKNQNKISISIKRHTTKSIPA